MLIDYESPRNRQSLPTAPSLPHEPLTLSSKWIALLLENVIKERLNNEHLQVQFQKALDLWSHFIDIPEFERKTANIY
jgi:hypothetical protein